MKIGALVLTLGLLATPALASPPTRLIAPFSAHCNAMATLTHAIADGRDEGLTSEQVKTLIAGSPEPEQTKTIGIALTTMIYGYPALTPDQLASATLMGCLEVQ